MKLLKVSVPNFRNLKNVELTFEPSLKPAVFPIGSENGGGKSTLLQLIFVLLTCSLDDNKNIYLSNFLISVIDNFQDTDEIAQFELNYQGEIINFTFTYLDENDSDNQKTIKFTKEILNFKKDLQDKSKEITNIDQIISEKRREYMGELSGLLEKKSKDIEKLEEGKQTLILQQEEIKQYIKSTNSRLLIYQKELKILCCNYIAAQDKWMICKTNIDNFEISYKVFAYASKNIYLVTPPTQMFLFLDREIKKLMDGNFADYYNKVNAIRKKIANIYIYNQLSIIAIKHAFKQAREQDFKTALENDNLEYGTELKGLAEDFHQFLGNDKYIKPSPDMNSIIVERKISENEFIELEPEELSHGELKKLGLYAWIKYNNINDSIILIDEIENGFHPDWQYNIVNELASWGDNQYLLATHSLYLCEVLTPAHVKEIEPKMLNPNSEE